MRAAAMRSMTAMRRDYNTSMCINLLLVGGALEPSGFFVHLCGPI